MNKKYIESSLLLTKEAIAEHILKQRIEQAKKYGMTLEQFMEAVIEGKTITPISGSYSI
jgi:DNA-binding transcriptional regulator YhcF (GntR family)